MVIAKYLEFSYFLLQGRTNISVIWCNIDAIWCYA